MQRIVLKIGTQVLLKAKKNSSTPIFSASKLQCICNQIIPYYKKKVQFIIVSSGAIGLGSSTLKLKHPLKTIEKQACASVGQSLLMQNYQKFFLKHKIPIGQILLTAEDFTQRSTYLNLSHTIEKLLSLNVIPIINENDTVSTSEIKENSYAPSFGDNDKLSSLVASKLKASLLILLTTTDGLYNKNPELHKDAIKIPVIKDFQELNQIQCTGKSVLGRGGMFAKIEAAKIASLCGVPTLIASGTQKNTLSQILKDPLSLSDTRRGTMILPQTKLSEKKQWIAFSSGFRGVLTLNEGALHALVFNKSSILPSGVLSTQGNFPHRSILSIQDPLGNEIGRGLSFFSSDEIKKIQGKKSSAIFNILGENKPEVIIHRNYLALFINPDSTLSKERERKDL